ncbi:unnamed protein product [Arctogadus glacialis]
MASPALLLVLLLMMSSLTLQPSAAGKTVEKIQHLAAKAVKTVKMPIKMLIDNPEILIIWLKLVKDVGGPLAGSVAGVMKALGRCDGWSHFRVMIKSDEEILNADPCDPSPCVNGGQCRNLFAGIACQCVYPYHGNKCEKEVEYTEKALDDTMKNLVEAPEIQ